MTARLVLVGAVTFVVSAFVLIAVSSAAGLIIADYEFITVLALAAIIAVVVSRSARK